MSIINISHLSFAYDGSYDEVFSDVSLVLDSSWRLGFTGRNGRGKTTFLKLLTGQYEYKGKISAGVDFKYFPYEISDKTPAVRDIILAQCPSTEPWRIERELRELGLEPEVLARPFYTLSPGEASKAMLAGMFCEENSFLLIDEPTNHLDMDGRTLLGKYLAGKSGFILVSHDRRFLDSCIDHILSINRTNIDLQQGNFSSWWANKQAQDSYEQSENERLAKDIERLTQAAKRTEGWANKVEKTKYASKNSGLRPDRGYIGHKAAKMMKTSKLTQKRRENAAAEKTGLLKNIESCEALRLNTLKYHSDCLVRLEDISICYGDTKACLHVSFAVNSGERIALAGRNGCGKTSLLRLVQGETLSYTGQLIKGPSLKTSYVSQRTDGIIGSLDAFVLARNIDGTLLRAILRKLDFERAQFTKDISSYSQGQKKKLLLAASLCEKAHLYIWDEPLNYIDVFSRMQLENLLREYCPSMLFVEHDKEFCRTLADRIISL